MIVSRVWLGQQRSHPSLWPCVYMRMCAGDKRLLPVVDEVYTTRTLYRRLPAAWQSGSRKKERKDGHLPRNCVACAI